MEPLWTDEQFGLKVAKRNLGIERRMAGFGEVWGEAARVEGKNRALQDVASVPS